MCRLLHSIGPRSFRGPSSRRSLPPRAAGLTPRDGPAPGYLKQVRGCIQASSSVRPPCVPGKKVGDHTRSAPHLWFARRWAGGGEIHQRPLDRSPSRRWLATATRASGCWGRCGCTQPRSVVRSLSAGPTFAAPWSRSPVSPPHRFRQGRGRLLPEGPRHTRREHAAPPQRRGHPTGRLLVRCPPERDSLVRAGLSPGRTATEADDDELLDDCRPNGFCLIWFLCRNCSAAFARAGE